MKNEFVPYELALRMKRLGFDKPCFGFYDEWDNNKAIGGNYPCDGINSAPTFSQAFRWFRKKYCLSPQPHRDGGFWNMNIVDFSNEEEQSPQRNVIFVKPFEEYEEAELASLIKLIEIIEKR